MLKFSEIFEFSRENSWILKEFEWFEWFEWFGPSMIEPFNSGFDPEAAEALGGGGRCLACSTREIHARKKRGDTGENPAFLTEESRPSRIDSTKRMRTEGGRTCKIHWLPAIDHSFWDFCRISRKRPWNVRRKKSWHNLREILHKKTINFTTKSYFKVYKIQRTVL